MFFVISMSVNILTAQTTDDIHRYKGEIKVKYVLSSSLEKLILADQMYDQTPTSNLTGFEIQIKFLAKQPHLEWLSGAFFQRGLTYGSLQYTPISNGWVTTSTNYTSTYGGGVYFGPCISTDYKYVNVSSYFAGGIFSFHDEMFKAEQGVIVYSHNANFTAPGSKAGISLDFSYKAVTLSLGYQIFVTAGQGSTLLYHGFEGGLGIKF